MAHSTKRKKLGSSSPFCKMLPLGVQTRLPLFSCLRQSFSAYAVCTQQYQNGDGNNCHAESMSLGFIEEKPNNKSSSLEPAPQVLCPPPRSSDASWKYARQGLALLENAMAEAQNSDSGNQAFSRRAYINSLSYLLQALPSDLNEVEILYLKQSFPTTLQPDPHAPHQTHPKSPPEKPPRSALHRFLAALILQIFILLHILLPYIKYFLHSAHNYDRKHHTSERLVSMAIDIADRFRKRGVDIVYLLMSMSNGTLGVIILWLVEGISGGIYEGVGKGLSIMRQSESEIQKFRF